MEASGKYAVLVRVVRFLLGGLFVWAGVVKFLDPFTFADSLATYEMLPQGVVMIVAVALPPVEIAVGLMLILGYHARFAAIAIGLLGLVFLVAMVQAVARGLQVDCGCLGGVEQSSSTQAMFTIGRDILILAAAIWLYRAAIQGAGSNSPEPE